MLLLKVGGASIGTDVGGDASLGFGVDAGADNADADEDDVDEGVDPGGFVNCIPLNGSTVADADAGGRAAAGDVAAAGAAADAGAVVGAADADSLLLYYWVYLVLLISISRNGSADAAVASAVDAAGASSVFFFFLCFIFTKFISTSFSKFIKIIWHIIRIITISLSYFIYLFIINFK